MKKRLEFFKKLLGLMELNLNTIIEDEKNLEQTQKYKEKEEVQKEEMLFLERW